MRLRAGNALEGQLHPKRPGGLGRRGRQHRGRVPNALRPLRRVARASRRALEGFVAAIRRCRGRCRALAPVRLDGRRDAGVASGDWRRLEERGPARVLVAVAVLVGAAVERR